VDLLTSFPLACRFVFAIFESRFSGEKCPASFATVAGPGQSVSLFVDTPGASRDNETGSCCMFFITLRKGVVSSNLLVITLEEKIAGWNLDINFPKRVRVLSIEGS